MLALVAAVLYDKTESVILIGGAILGDVVYAIDGEGKLSGEFGPSELH